MTEPLRSDACFLQDIASDLQGALLERQKLEVELKNIYTAERNLRNQIGNKQTEIDRFKLELSLASGVVKRDARALKQGDAKQLSDAELKAADDSIAETAKAFGLEKEEVNHSGRE